MLLLKDVSVKGRRRSVKNYHELSNNVVFPIEGEEVMHFHTKKTKNGGPRLAPTLR